MKEVITCDSIILEESKRKDELLNQISDWCGYKTMKLLYRGSRDGSTSKIFHEKCDNQGPTICLYKNEKGYIFGGFAPISWTDKGGHHSSQGSFIFTLTNIYGIKPTKFPCTDKNMVFHEIEYGPTFNDDICIYSDFGKGACYSAFPYKCKDTLGKGNSIFTNNKSSDLNIKEIEVFKLVN